MDRFIAVALLGLASQVHAKPAAAAHDCEAARALPADANEEARRIACDIPAKYQYDVSMAELIGQRMRLHDMAAWLTTDALVERKAFEGLQGEGRGWLTWEEANGDVDVRYFTERDGRIEAIASARLDVGPFKVADAKKLDPAQPMTVAEQRLMRAKLLALGAEGVNLCTRAPPNTVVFQFEEDGRNEILVFVMSAWTGDAAPLGGYHMFRVSEDGETIKSHFSQTAACPMADAKGFASTSSLMVSHLKSAAPTMFHVFMSLQYRKPLYVATTQNGLLWRVEQGRIHLVEQEPGADKAGADAGKKETAG